ncbi:MAG: hypothetical protein MI919_31120, partial [Holophagales bacterium]|nr:hypothetical protein [Holophagales bacterium]
MSRNLLASTASGLAGLGSPAASDRTLLAAVARGDRSAFEVLYLRYHPPLLGFLSRWIPNRERAEEVLQDVMFVVW